MRYQPVAMTLCNACLRTSLATSCSPDLCQDQGHEEVGEQDGDAISARVGAGSPLRKMAMGLLNETATRQLRSRSSSRGHAPQSASRIRDSAGAPRVISRAPARWVGEQAGWPSRMARSYRTHRADQDH
jgi:hypothetical protein